MFNGTFSVIKTSMIAILIFLLAHISISALSAISPSSWITEAWTDNDQRFIEARSEVDGIVKSTPNNIARLLHQYRDNASRGTANAIKLYKWAYFAYRVEKSIPRLRGIKDVQDAGPALGSCPSPHSYEFSRLRFIMLCGNYNVNTRDQARMIPLGERLLDHNPADDEVRSDMIRIMCINSASAEAQALRYANQMLRRDPHNAKAYESLGYIHFNMWIAHRMSDKHEAELALNAYKRYLELRPDDADSVVKTQETIRLIESRQH